MFAEELLVLDADASLWSTARPLLDAALRLERGDEAGSWHGWNKEQIAAFLQHLPEHCALLVGVWETMVGEDEKPELASERESLTVGFVCEIFAGEVRSIRTFTALDAPDLLPIQELEPGFEHAQVLLHAVKSTIAPVAWALFTDKATWDEWLFAAGEDGDVIDKGEVLAALARQGRCVLMRQQIEGGPWKSKQNL